MASREAQSVGRNLSPVVSQPKQLPAPLASMTADDGKWLHLPWAERNDSARAGCRLRRCRLWPML